MVRVRSSDGEVLEVRRAVAEMSGTLRNMLTVAAGSEAIPLDKVKARELRAVFEYCNYHHDNPGEASRFTKGGRVDNFRKWDREFTERLKTDKLWPLFETIVAANFLEVKPLLEILCRTVAAMIKGRTPDEISDIFSIRKDITEAELEEVRRANPWLREL